MKRRGLFAMIAGAVGIKAVPTNEFKHCLHAPIRIRRYANHPWPPILQRVQFIPHVSEGGSLVNAIFEVEADKLKAHIEQHGWPVGPAQKAIREFGRPVPDGMGYNFKNVDHEA